MKSRGWLKLLLSIVVLAAIFFSVSAQSDSPKLYSEKSEYAVNENILLSIDSQSGKDLSGQYELVIIEGTSTSKFLGSLVFPVVYVPARESILKFQLISKATGRVVSELSIAVTDAINTDVAPAGIANSCETAEIILEKQTYYVNEEILMTVKNRPLDKETSIIITTANKIFRHQGNSDYAIFPAEEAGNYDVFFECGGKQTLYTRFAVEYPENIPQETPKVIQSQNYADLETAGNSKYPFVIENSKGAKKNIDYEVKFGFRGMEKEIKNPTSAVKSIKFRGLNDYLPLLKIEDLEEPYPVNDIPSVQSYAIDPTSLNFQDATLTAVAKGDALYKCRQYDFAANNCYGSWEKVRDLVPGQEYDITLTPEDPLYSELNSSFRCSCQQAITNSNAGTLRCDVVCQHTINIPANATSYKLSSMIYNVTITITKSAGMSVESGSHFGNYDHNQILGDGNEAAIGSSTTTVTTTALWTNSAIAQSGSGSFSDLDCSNWPSYCNYYVYLNTSYTYQAPGAARRDVTLNISINAINYTLNYTTPGNFSVTLVSPEHNYYSNSRYLPFVYTPVDATYNITNCSIYTNDTSWSIKNSSTSITNSSQNTLMANFSSDGIFAWNIRCSDTNGANISAVTNRSVIIDTTRPYISQISPTAGYTETSSSVVEFNFNASDSSGIRNCSLYIDGIKKSTSSAIVNNGVNIISFGLANGVYNWSIGCYDYAGNWNTSVNRTLTMSVTPVIYRGYWYESYSTDCATTPCQIDLKQNTDGTENAVTGTINPAQTVSIVQANSPYMGSNGAYVASGSTVTFSSYFLAAGGALTARWYLYYENTSGGTNLICSTAGGAGVTGGAASTGTCSPSSDIRLQSTDKLYYVIDITNTHPSQSRTFDHRIDYVSSFLNASGFLQLGTLYAALVYPTTPTTILQGSVINMTCNVTCDFGSCVNTQVYAQYNNSGTWTTISSGAGIVRLNISETNPHNLSNVFNTTIYTSFGLNGTSPGITQVRCYVSTKYGNYNTSSFPLTIVSTSAPNITLQFPGNNSWVNTSSIVFRYNPQSYSAVSNCTLFVNDIYNYTNYSITPSVTNNFYVSGFTDTLYNWSVSCIDVNGRQGNSSVYHFNVDTAIPYSIQLHELENATNTTNPSVYFNWTAYDMRSENLSCALLINGTVNQTILSFNGSEANATVNNLKIGNYTWAVRCTDAANNSNRSETRFFSVVDQGPKINLAFPRNNTGVNTTSPVLFYNATDNFGLGECRLFINGVYNSSNTTNLVNGAINNFTVTGLNEQPYNWSVLCFDDNDNNATSSNWTFYVDITYPSIQLYTPSNDSLLNISSVQFAYNATDNWAPMTCSILMDNVVKVNTNTTSGNIVNLTRTGYPDGSHTWYVSCTDIGNNTNISEIRNLTINSTPFVTQVSPLDKNYLGSGNVTLYYNASDNDGFSVCSLFINGELNLTNSSNITNSGRSNFSLLNLPDGSYNWSVSCIDNGTFSNSNYTSNWTFIIDTIPPNISLVDPAESQTVITSSYYFRWNATDNNADAMLCNISLNGLVNATNMVAFNQNITGYTISGLRTGSYNWSVSCIDNATRLGYSETVNFTVILPPKVNITSPANNTGSSIGLTNFKFIPSEGSGVFTSCTLILNGVPNATNTTIIPEVENTITTNLPDGKYDWNVNCTDSNSLSATDVKNWTYYIDLLSPYSVIAVYPRNGENVTRNNVSFIFNVSDSISPMLSCTIYLNDGTGFYSLASGLNATSMVNYTYYSILSDGNYSWYTDCTDIGGNFNVSKTNNFSIEAPPNVTLMSPSNYSWFSGSNVSLVYMPSDDIQITSCTLFIDGNSNESNGIILNNQNNTFTLTNLIPKQYNWTVQCRDSDSNLYAPSNYTFYVDHQKPAMSLYNPADTQTLNRSTVMFNFSAEDDLSPLIYCNLTIDGTINQSNLALNNSVPYNLTISGFNDGIHYWNLTCSDLAGNRNTSSTSSFTVAEPPKVELNAPDNNYRTNLTSFTLYYTPKDNSGNIQSCSLLINGIENDTKNSITDGAQNNFTISGFAGGNYSWDVNCTDASGNSAANGTARYFHIDLFPPNITLLYPLMDQTFNTNNITFNWTAVDFNSSILVNCSIAISDALGLRTFNGLSSYSGLIQNYTEFNLTEGEHYWNITCMDDFGNSNTSITRRFYINQPDLLLNSSGIVFNNTNPVLGESINITANVSNIGGITAVNASVEFWDGDPSAGGSLIGTDRGDVGANASRIFSINWTIGEGYHIIYVIPDPANLIGELSEANNNASKNISVLRVIIEYPLNNSLFNYNNMSFNFTLQDYTSGQINYSVYVDGILNGQSGNLTDNVSTILNISLNEGIRRVIIQATDSLMRKRNSSAVWITIDKTPPNSSILTPNNTWFNYTNPQINITSRDNLDSMINYTIYVNGTENLKGNITNGTSILVALGIVNEGVYQIIMEAFDDANNTANSTSKQIYVDLTPPSTTLNSPAGGVNYSVRSVTLNYTPSDNLAAQLYCNLTLDGTIVNSQIVQNGNATIYSALNIPEGQHYWNVTCMDQAGNTNTSETRNFNIYIGPSIYLVNPRDNYWSRNTTNIFYFNVSDESGLENCSLLLNGTIAASIQNSEILNNQTNNISISGMSGTYIWAVACFDNTSYRAYNISANRTINVDTINPSSLFYTLNDTWYNANPLIYFNLSDNMDSVLNYTIYINGTANQSGIANNGQNSSAVLTSLSDGTYEIILEAWDEAFNYFNSTSIIIGLDRVLPSVTLLSPGNNSNMTTTWAELNFTVTDASPRNLVCRLTLDNVPVLQNRSVASGEIVNYTTGELLGGYHFWNVTCVDVAGNTNTSATWRFYILRPDIYVNPSNIIFSNNAPVENETIGITAQIENIGTTAATNFTVEFYEGLPGQGRKINGNISINLSAGESKNVTVQYTTTLGTKELWVFADRSNNISEENESNNNASKSLTVGLWHFAMGTTTDRLVTRDGSLDLLYDWEIENSSRSNVFVVDSDSNVNWLELQALGRDTSNNSQFNDFAELDNALNSTGFADSINTTYTSLGAPAETAAYTIYSRIINDVPVHDSTDNSNFKTGILWDYSDGGSQFNTSQDVIFVTTMQNQLAGYNGSLNDYEIRIPATLRSYKGPAFDRVDFYMEIR